jgi:hypothetical protein
MTVPVVPAGLAMVAGATLASLRRGRHHPLRRGRAHRRPGRPPAGGGGVLLGHAARRASAPAARRGDRRLGQVDRVAEAHEARAAGADAIIAQGSEAGGHNRAEAATMTLLPAVIRAAAPLPAPAAGGGDGAGLVAVLALGAEAAWCGIRLLASAQAEAHPGAKRAVVEARVGDTARGRLRRPMHIVRPARFGSTAGAAAWRPTGGRSCRIPCGITARATRSCR